MRYAQRKDGEGWSIRNREMFRIGCCDCGLVHDLVIHVRGRRKGFIVGIAGKRNERATAQKRKEHMNGRANDNDDKHQRWHAV